jgi:hypothetical protein
LAQHRQICDRAVFDGSFDDPRTLMYFYQQKLRGQLLAKAAGRANRPSVWSLGLRSVGSAIRWLITVPPVLVRGSAVATSAR